MKNAIARHPLLIVASDFNVAHDDRDVHDPALWAGQIMCSDAERAAFRSFLAAGLVDSFRLFEQAPKTFSWWDYRQLAFPKNAGLRIDHILLSTPLAERCVSCRIDREARKGKPIPSDHAPLVIDLDRPGQPFDAGWAAADERIAARLAKAPLPVRSGP